jgi:hypothetical protein
MYLSIFSLFKILFLMFDALTKSSSKSSSWNELVRLIVSNSISKLFFKAALMYYIPSKSFGLKSKSTSSALASAVG